MSAQPVSDGSLIGFLLVAKTAQDDGFIAAFITDGRGYPLEFRATTPVRPSLVQKTLYGKQLEHFVGVELCGKTLVQQSSRKPRTILVPEKHLLDIRDYVDADILAVWRAGEALHLEDEVDAAVTRGNIKASGSQALVYEGRFAGTGRETEVVTHLEDCAGRFDLVEVFERMKAALQTLSKEDARYA